MRLFHAYKLLASRRLLCVVGLVADNPLGVRCQEIVVAFARHLIGVRRIGRARVMAMLGVVAIA